MLTKVKSCAEAYYSFMVRVMKKLQDKLVWQLYWQELLDPSSQEFGLTEPGLTSKLELFLSDNCGSVAPGLKNWMDDSPPHSKKNSRRTKYCASFEQISHIYIRILWGENSTLSLNILGNLLVILPLQLSDFLSNTITYLGKKVC